MSIPFELDQRLAADTVELFDSINLKVLLMRNAYYPWLIIVPKTEHIELIDLSVDLRQKVDACTNQLAQFVRREFQIDKLNIAAIGNVVSQLHIHVVGRSKDDPAWPGVVWGHSAKKTYVDNEISKIKEKLIKFLSSI